MKRSTAAILLCLAVLATEALNRLFGGTLTVLQVLPLGGLAILFGIPGALAAALYAGVMQSLAWRGVLPHPPLWQSVVVVVMCLVAGAHHTAVERRRSHAQMQRRLIEGLRNGVLFADERLTLGLTNPSAARLLVLPSDAGGRMARLTDLGLVALWRHCKDTRHEADAVECLLDGRMLRIQAAPVIEDGSVVGIVTTVSDVTEERQSAQLRDDFLAFVSHEMRNPLSAITGYAEVLLTHHMPEGLGTYTQVIKRNADRLLRLIRDLLQLNTLESGAFHLDPCATDLRSLLQDLAEEMRESAVKVEVGVRVDPGRGCAVGQYDPGRLAQVFANLLDNAIRHAQAGTTVRIALTVTDGHGLVEVNNVGPDIPCEALESIFEKHRRLGNTHNAARDGAGLGLAICRHLVDLHGGRIWATSDPELGTSFWVSLPLVAREPHAERAAAE